MEITKVANRIQKIIQAIGEERRALRDAGQKKAKAISNYDRALQIKIMELSQGTAKDDNGEPVPKPPASYTEKIAKGLCWQERLELEQADGAYKAVISNLEALKAQLNGYQSIFRHLEET